MAATSHGLVRILAIALAALGAMTASSRAGDQAPPAPSPLDGTGWRLVSGDVRDVQLPTDLSRVTLKFAQGRVSAQSGCNTGTSGYSLNGETLVIAAFATTRMLCPEPLNQWEAAFFAILSSSPAMTRTGDQLSLTSGKGGLAWVAIPMPSANAVRKFVYVAAERVPCTGVAPMMCLQVRDTPDAPWRFHYGEIIGFTHEPGVEYRLRILEDTVARPPADGSSTRWFLDLIVEQSLPKR